MVWHYSGGPVFPPKEGGLEFFTPGEGKSPVFPPRGGDPPVFPTRLLVFPPRAPVFPPRAPVFPPRPPVFPPRQPVFLLLRGGKKIGVAPGKGRVGETRRCSNTPQDPGGVGGLSSCTLG